jgi:hypothetical protein
MHVLKILLFVAAGLMTVSVLTYVSQIGKPREPIRPEYAAVSVLVNAGIIAVMVLGAVRL